MSQNRKYSFNCNPSILELCCYLHEIKTLLDHLGVAVEVVGEFGLRLPDRQVTELCPEVQQVALEGAFLLETVVDVVEDVIVPVGFGKSARDAPLLQEVERHDGPAQLSALGESELHVADVPGAVGVPVRRRIPEAVEDGGQLLDPIRCGCVALHHRRRNWAGNDLNQGEIDGH